LIELDDLVLIVAHNTHLVWTVSSEGVVLDSDSPWSSFGHFDVSTITTIPSSFAILSLKLALNDWALFFSDVVIDSVSSSYVDEELIETVFKDLVSCFSIVVDIDDWIKVGIRLLFHGVTTLGRKLDSIVVIENLLSIMLITIVGAHDTEMFDVTVRSIKMSLEFPLSGWFLNESGGIRNSLISTSWSQEFAAGDWALVVTVLVIEERIEGISNNSSISLWSRSTSKGYILNRISLVSQNTFIISVTNVSFDNDSLLGKSVVTSQDLRDTELLDSEIIQV